MDFFSLLGDDPSNSIFGAAPKVPLLRKPAAWKGFGVDQLSKRDTFKTDYIGEFTKPLNGKTTAGLSPTAMAGGIKGNLAGTIGKQTKQSGATSLGSKVGGFLSNNAGLLASGAIDGATSILSAYSDPNATAASKDAAAVSGAVDTVSSTLMSSGNPIGMAAGAAIKGIDMVGKPLFNSALYKGLANFDKNTNKAVTESSGFSGIGASAEGISKDVSDYKNFGSFGKATYFASGKMNRMKREADRNIKLQGEASKILNKNKSAVEAATGGAGDAAAKNMYEKYNPNMYDSIQFGKDGMKIKNKHVGEYADPTGDKDWTYSIIDSKWYGYKNGKMYDLTNYKSTIKTLDNAYKKQDFKTIVESDIDSGNVKKNTAFSDAQNPLLYNLKNEAESTSIKKQILPIDIAHKHKPNKILLYDKNGIPNDVNKIINENKKNNNYSNYKGNTYQIISKTDGKTYIIDKNHKIIKSFNVGIGESDLDDQNVFYENKTTPSGRYSILGIGDSPKYVNTYGTKAYFINRNSKEEEIINKSNSRTPFLALHGIPKYELEYRSKIINNNQKCSKNVSAGCVNFNKDDLNELNPAVGDSVYVTPHVSALKRQLSRSFKLGGEINVIVNGKLHKELHHMDVDDVIKKGVPIATMKDGGKLIPNKLTKYDEILTDNKNVPFVHRLLTKDTRSIFVNGKNPSTHLMSSYGKLVMPQVFDNGFAFGKLKYIYPGKNMDSVYDSNNKIEFNTEAEAEDFAKNYKKSNIYKEFEKAGKFKLGGKINIIVNGKLHKELHHMDMDDVTKKGVPVVTMEDGGEVVQHAEVERDEMILHLELTKKLEELKEEGSDDSMIEAGKLLAYEIVKNTKDSKNKIIKNA